MILCVNSATVGKTACSKVIKPHLNTSGQEAEPPAEVLGHI